MKPHALLINAARSGVVVEADLARILAEGRIRGAALDCFADDGRAENPFLSIPAERVLLTPHLAGVTRAAFGRMPPFLVTVSRMPKKNPHSSVNAPAIKNICAVASTLARNLTR